MAWQDHPGLMAVITRTLAERGLAVEEAVLATWPDGAVLDAFRVPVGDRPEAVALALAIQLAAGQPLRQPPFPRSS